MKTRILLVALFTTEFADLCAQDPNISTSRSRIHLEVITGPTLITYDGPILPSVNYHLGAQAIRQLRRGGIQWGLQYIPMEAAFGGFTLKKTNHAIATSFLYKLWLFRPARLTLDAGLSYGITVAQTESHATQEYYMTGIGRCGMGPHVEPELARGSQLMLQVGMSSIIMKRFKVALAGSLGGPTSTKTNYYAYNPAFSMLQGTVGYRIF